jgi:nitrogen-specific signal transduction histidine kinase
MLTLFISSVIAFIFDISLATFLLVNNNKKTTNITFACFLYCLSLWIFGDFFHFIDLFNSYHPVIFVRLAHIGAVFTPAFFVHFVISFSRTEVKAKWLYSLYIASGLLAIINICSDLFVENAGLIVEHSLLLINIGFFYNIFILEILVLLIISYYILFKKHRISKGKLRNQIEYFFLATGVIILALCFYIPAVIGLFHIRIDNIFHIIYPSIIVYAICKHRLMDVEVVISRIIAKFLTHILFLSVFFCIYFYNYKNANLLFLAQATIFIILACETFHYLLKQIQKLPDKFLLKNYYDYKEVFNLISESFDRCISINDLLVMLETQIRAYLDTAYVKIYIIENFQMAHSYGDSYLRADYDALADKTSEKIEAKEFLKISQGLSDFIIFDDDDNKFADIKNLVNKPDAAIFFPLKSLDKIVGFVILGPKDSEKNYTFNDLTLIELIKLQVDIILNRIEAYEIVRSNLSKAEKIASLIKLMNHYNHELKAPWAILMQSLELPSTTLELLSAQVEKQWFRSEKLINTMTRIIKDQHKRIEEQLNLNDIIKSVERIYPIRGCGTVVRNLDPDLPNIIGDKQDLQILFCNIFKNAMEACRKQSYTENERDPDKFFVSTKHNKKTKQITVQVKDQGVGIPKEKLENIWESGLSTNEAGTGVGMGIIKRIIDEHGAQVVIESAEGGGCCLTIIFKN